MKQRFTVIATSLVTYSTVIEADSPERAGELAFVMNKPDWCEIGEPDWQIDRVVPVLEIETKPVPAYDRDAMSKLLERKAALTKRIAERKETLSVGLLPPHAAMELTGRQNTARMELNGIEDEIARMVEA